MSNHNIFSVRNKKNKNSAECCRACEGVDANLQSW